MRRRVFGPADPYLTPPDALDDLSDPGNVVEVLPWVGWRDHEGEEQCVGGVINAEDARLVGEGGCH